ncbi:hypothetical protein AU476_03750 [Cupriavidus sp. UYMSc13B]|nr:hypothetical protein AU476_03750 [Cupriavidus sp. UYMSc13B]
MMLRWDRDLPGKAPSIANQSVTFAEFVYGNAVDLGVLFPAFPNAQGVRVYIGRSRISISVTESAKYETREWRICYLWLGRG